MEIPACAAVLPRAARDAVRDRHPGGDGELYRRAPVSGHGAEEIQIPQHQGGFGGHRHRMAAGVEYLQHLPGNPEPALDRLVRVRDSTEHGGRGSVAGPSCQLPLQLLGGVGLVEESALEIQPRRQPEPGMRRPCVTVNAAMLAAAVGIDGTLEGHVRRSIPADDGAAGIHRKLGAQGFRRLLIPTVVDRLAAVVRVAIVRVGNDAAAPLQCATMVAHVAFR